MTIDNRTKCLDALSEWSTSDGEQYTYFRTIQSETGLGRNEVRDHVRSLAHEGFAIYSKALTNEDGIPAGAGYRITDAGVEELMRVRASRYTLAELIERGSNK